MQIREHQLNELNHYHHSVLSTSPKVSGEREDVKIVKRYLIMK